MSHLSMPLALALIAVAAPAQEPPAKPVDEIVTDLALGHCPVVLAGQFSFRDNPVLTAMGFPAVPRAEFNVRFGSLSIVERPHPDGNIRFGGASGQVCQVVLDGPKRPATLARIRRAMTDMAGMGIAFRPVPRPAAAPAGLKVEAFKADVAPGQTLNLLLAEPQSPRPTLVAQLFATTR